MTSQWTMTRGQRPGGVLGTRVDIKLFFHSRGHRVQAHNFPVFPVQPHCYTLMFPPLSPHSSLMHTDSAPNYN